MLALHAGAQESPKAPSSRLDETAAKRLQRLKEQADRSPGNKSYLYDYIQALEEAGLDTDVLAMRARLDPASTPSTVLARIGRAANNQKQFPVAVDYFEEALKKAPDSVDIIAGLSYALVDNNRAPDAQRLLEGKSGLLRNHVPLLDAYAESLRAQREDAHALLAYQRILELDPNNREAKRNEILTVGKLGAPHRAIELAELSPGLLGEEELASLRGDRSVVVARWGAATDRNGPNRFAGIDAALAENGKLLGKASGSGRRRLQFDRVVLLRDRYRMKEAVSLYEEMVAAYSDPPAYVKVAAADAYLYLEKPERARDLYKAAVAQGDNSTGTEVGLFYAYNEAEQHKQALDQIDRLVAQTPRQSRAYSPLTVADNPDYASSTATAGAARGYQDYNADAQKRLEEFRDVAP